MTIKAVYENGVFRPTENVSLPEGTSTEIVVTSKAEQGSLTSDPRTLAEMIAEIAKIPPDGPEPDDGLVGSEDVDKILYGGPDGAA